MLYFLFYTLVLIALLVLGGGTYFTFRKIKLI